VVETSEGTIRIDYLDRIDSPDKAPLTTRVRFFPNMKPHEVNHYLHQKPDESHPILCYEGLAHRVPNLDNFNRHFGRKLALRRAIKSLPKETRKHIWQEFFERCGK
jgi:hypothetical protein